MHTHGLRVSPLGNSDNPFLAVDPGTSFDYLFRVPPDHPAGTFWYHPHHHGVVANQIFGGLAGALLVEHPARAGTRTSCCRRPGAAGHRHHPAEQRHRRSTQCHGRNMGIPALLGGRIFTHRLSAVEAEHDIIALGSDLAPLSMLTECETYQRLTDGSPIADVYFRRGRRPYGRRPASLRSCTDHRHRRGTVGGELLHRVRGRAGRQGGSGFPCPPQAGHAFPRSIG